MRLQWPAFSNDSRGNRLKAYRVMRPRDDLESAVRWVELCGPEEVARQVGIAFAGAVRQVPLPESRMAEWTHRFEMRRGLPEGMLDMLELLKEVLTIPRSHRLDVAVTFDFYKIPPAPGGDQKNWPNTPFGELVHRAKYWHMSPFKSRAAFSELVTSTASFMARHPLYAPVAYIISVPGHKGTGGSFGEKYAESVAAASGKKLISCEAKGERAASKEGNPSDSDAEFHILSTLRGPAIIIDDVYRSGGTMRSVAQAAKKAGAGRVFGFAAVKTMRN